MKPVLLDLDGVLADFVRGYSLLANDMYGTPVISSETLAQWSIEEALGLQETQRKVIWNVINGSDTFWENLPCLVNESVFQKIAKLGSDVVFMTVRPPAAKAQTRAWLDSRGLVQPCLHVTNKAPAVMMWPGGYFVDDNPHHVHGALVIAAATNRFDNWKICLLDQAYNRGWKSNGNELPKVATLDEFLYNVVVEKGVL